MHALLEPIEAGSNLIVRRLVLKSQQYHGGCIGMGRKWLSVDNPISCVPATRRTDAIEQHLHATPNPEANKFRRGSKESQLQGEKRIRCGHDPTHCLWHPRPAEFVRIEAHVTVRCLEFPLPQPMGLPASKPQKPVNRSLGRSALDARAVESENSQPCETATLLVVTRKCRPAAIEVLCVDQEADSKVRRWAGVRAQGEQG